MSERCAMCNAYNGWPNYETWCVNLHLGNTEWVYASVRQVVAQAKEDGAECTQVEEGIWTEEQAIRFTIQDYLKEWVEQFVYGEIGERLGVIEGDAERLFITDLVGSALDEVDWYCLAEHYMEDD